MNSRAKSSNNAETKQCLEAEPTNHCIAQPSSTHSVIAPSILYWGTPVVLITTVNPDGIFNIAPMSSAWWLLDFCVLGLAKHSQTTQNLLRTKQCVLNLPSDDMTACVNALARTTGSDPVPEMKVKLGYSSVKDKFGLARLTPQVSEIVKPPRIRECPVQMEVEFVGELDMGFVSAIQVRVLRIHVVDRLRLAGYANRINPDAWKPMFMSFQKLYGLRNGELAQSQLAKIDEDVYRAIRK